MIKRAWPWIAVGAVAAVLAAAGFWLLFTTFMIYDDEGYVLLSLKNFSASGGLYDRVYTQYGPFLYFFYDALHRLLGFEFTNTSGRWITLFNWFGTAAACAALVARQTRSALWAGFTLAGVFTYLWVMINEPVHPGGLLSLLVAVGVWLGAEAWSAGRITRFAAITGLVGAALALTKINVGVFFLGAAFAWLAVNTASPPIARTLGWLVAAGCALLPFVLMHALWSSPWVRIFAVVFAGGALGTLLAARAAARPVAGRTAWLVFFGSGTGAGALLCLLTMLRGTSVRGLIDGVVLEPLKHPGVYFFAMNWRPGAAALALAGAAAAALAVRRGGVAHPRFRTGIALARLAAGGFFFASPLQLISTSLAAWGMSYGVALAWICVVPLRDDDRTAGVRAWVALALVFQCLHAYPVAGSQINWGTYLWVPLLALALHDAAPVAAALLGRGWRLAALAGAVLVAGVTVTMAEQLEKIGRGRYYSSDQPLGLPGAENIRPPPDTVYAMRIVDENARAHAGLLFSFPGLYSTNLWTGIPTPTLANATHWFSLLSPERQQEIIDRLDAEPRAVLLVQRDVVNYLTKAGFPMVGPLHDWLMAHFESAFSVDGYEFWVRRGRTVAALSTARLAPNGAAGEELVLTLATPARPVTRIDLCDFNAPALPLMEFTGEGTDLSLQSITLKGDATAAPVAVHFPVTFNGPARVILRYPKTGAQIVRGHGLVVLRDAAGAVVAEARVLD